ncbi:helix-turn-helix domain-containing protein [Ruegeria sp. EL01]|uniref:helix-turn-helix domain-containing protein n=1 Tax=Ruegeria sp. EL01 TaxID=2107578 RepID=UPI000EA81EF8|nr:helix-turn-helix transcriptional regulator [Ruegeria sp. EL01]
MTNSIDDEVGRQIRHLRWANGTTREQLADVMQLSGEEIEHYECGTSRVSAHNLWRLAEFFAVPVTSFFDLDKSGHSDALSTERIMSEIMSDPEAAKIVRAYYALSADKRRKMF